MAETTTHGATALTFHKTVFSVIQHTDGQIWLRGQEISAALGMANARQLGELYKSNLAEFTDTMTALVKMPTSGGPQDVRIFSLRGAHLLAMFSRTDRASAFRRWVLDQLDTQGEGATPAAPAALASVTAERDALREALLSQNPAYRQIMRYHAIPGLTQTERAKLMGWSSPESWRRALLKLAELKLIDYRPDPRGGAKALIAHTAGQRSAKAGDNV